jgi:hypothetical protein
MLIDLPIWSHKFFVEKWVKIATIDSKPTPNETL